MNQNAMAFRANQAYRGAAVAVPPLKAVVMLCDGAITFLQKALECQEARRLEEGHDYLTRATAILRGLSHHLDCNRGGAVAERLFTTYNALILAAHRAYGRPQARENYRRIIAAIAELRDAWKAVAAATSVPPPGAAVGARR
ncbi:flagellar export chaperone FliS [Bradyrhizobium sp. WD16]|uniref:flagellar export chaperone FliS n=1 Tax=Bradyrhizobium sp. WD16 TaxID=1521768 RepID=UPI0020A4A819|nr:flagellar export chaperone FliS [Bradyrhizobium sp. WD16]UTD25540.1 flagellar protein FliS [Bradyrhizobium sp. WD16]